MVINESELSPGTIIGEKYEVLKKIGQGGMSSVYLVMDSHLRKNWALKEVRRDGTRDFAILRQGLMVEVEMLKKLEHPNLPRIIDVIETQDVIYIVMDYIEGMTLKDVLKEYGAQPQESVIEWGKQICDVLNYLHTRKPAIIYRDMKPGNIMLKPEGGVVLFDFGIARAYDRQKLEDTQYLGTIGYAAPEQFGHNGQTDPRTDIFGLGATLYHLVTGMIPGGEPPYKMHPIRQVDPRLSSGLEKIIIKCTQPNPDERYQSSAELMYALQNYNHLDEEYRTGLKRKVRTFAIPLILSTLCFCLAGLSYGRVLAERKQDYFRNLKEADEKSYKSLDEAGFDKQEVIALYDKTIKSAPKDETEGIQQLLEYCFQIGETQKGLDKVAAYISSGEVGRGKYNEVVRWVADTYFWGNEKDPDFEPDYQRAAIYYAKIKNKDTEAQTLFELSKILGGTFSEKEDWKQANENLKYFVDNTTAKGEEKARVCLRIAETYIENKLKFSEVEDLNPYIEAEILLKESKEEVNGLLKDAVGDSKDDFQELQCQILKDLEVIYSRVTEDADDIDNPVHNTEEAKVCNGELLALLNERKDRLKKGNKKAEGKIRIIEDEIKAAELYRLDIYQQEGNDALIKKHFEKLIEDYPNDASAYFNYASFLFKKEPEKSYEMFKKGKECEGFESNINYLKLETKFENAQSYE